MLIIDIHCHPNLKSFNSGHPIPQKNIWDKIHHNINSKLAQSANDLSKHVLKESQCNLDALSAGNVRVFQISLYPVERGFLHIRNVPKILVGKRRINVFHEVVTGFSPDSITYLKKNYNYFKDLIREYEYIKSQQGKSPDGHNEFVLVNNYKELEASLKKKNTLIGIITIEGAHVLGTGAPDTHTIPKDTLKEQLSANIKTIKEWETPPFMMNLSHHFWNHLAGHSKSFKSPINSIVNQNKGKNRGITDLGWHVIRELLSKSNGKRIIIDTKHMSIASRKEYYAFIHNYNHLNPNDKIPVVISHAFANGYKTLDSSIKEADLMSKAKKSRLFKWSINVSDEEAKIVHYSEGLIGLMLDKGNLGGTDVIEEILKMEDLQKQREEFVRLFWDNIFQFIRAIGEKTAWNILALGTDYDGSINHINLYPSAADLQTLQNDLINFLESKNYQSELWYGYTPKELVEKIMHGNALAFYKKFFV